MRPGSARAPAGVHRGEGQHRIGDGIAREQDVEAAVDEPGVEASGPELRIRDESREEGKVGDDPCDREAAEGAGQAIERHGAILAMGDHLRDYRVVVRGDGVAFPHAAVDANLPRLRRHRHVREGAGRGQESTLGILGVDPRLHRVPRDRQLGLCGRKGLAGRDPELPLHEVGTGDHLGDRVLDLETRVHLHEPEPVLAQSVRGVGDELGGARAAVSDGPGRPDRGRAHRRAHRPGHARRRGLLDDLLVTALQGAVPLEEVHRVSMRVGEDLDLDVARPFDAALDEDPIVAEARTGLAPRRFQRGPELRLAAGAPHALAAAARDRLHQHGKADSAGVGEKLRIVLILAVVAGDHRHAGRLHRALGRILQAHCADRGGRRPDEDHSRGVACLDEPGVLGQESVPGVNRIRARRRRRGDHPLDVQVALRRGRRAEPPRLARRLHVPRVTIRVGVDRDGADAEPVRGAHHPACDLAPVGDEELAEHHIRNTPKRVSSIGAFSAAERERASTSRLRAGWTMPSSHSRALA